MFEATTSPWYLPTWVSSRTPVTSPTAHSPSAGPQRLSTGTPCLPGVIPDRVQAVRDPRAPARWPPAACRRAAPGRPPGSARSRRRRAGPPIACRPRYSSMPSLRSSSPRASPSGSGSRASTWDAPSTSATSPPRRRTAWAISAPTGPPPRISRRRGTAFMPVTSRLVHTPSSSRRPATGGMTGSEPVASTTCRAVCRAPLTSTTPGPASRPVPRSRSMPSPASQRDLPGVGVVRDHVVAVGQGRGHVDLGGARRLDAPRAPPRRDAAGSWTGCRRSTSTRRRPAALDHGHLQPAVGQLARAVLAGRARPQRR